MHHVETVCLIGYTRSDIDCELLRLLIVCASQLLVKVSNDYDAGSTREHSIRVQRTARYVSRMQSCR